MGKEVLEGTVKWRGLVYTNDWGQSKFKAVIVVGNVEETCYFSDIHSKVG